MELHLYLSLAVSLICISMLLLLKYIFSSDGESARNLGLLRFFGLKENQLLSVCDILDLISKVKPFPVHSIHGWTLTDCQHRHRLWKRNISHVDSVYAPDVYACSGKVHSSARDMLNFFCDANSVYEWSPMIMNVSYLTHSRHTSAGNIENIPQYDEVKEEIAAHPWWLAFNNTIIRCLLSACSLTGNTSIIYKRFWHREKNGCSWMLKMNEDKQTWTFFLAQPILDAEDHCLLSIIACEQNSCVTSLIPTMYLSAIQDLSSLQRLESLSLTSLSCRPREHYPSSNGSLHATDQVNPRRGDDEDNENSFMFKVKNFIGTNTSTPNNSRKSEMRKLHQFRRSASILRYRHTPMINNNNSNTAVIAEETSRVIDEVSTQPDSSDIESDEDSVITKTLDMSSITDQCHLDCNGAETGVTVANQSTPVKQATSLPDPIDCFPDPVQSYGKTDDNASGMVRQTQQTVPVLTMPRPSLAKLHPYLARVGIDQSLTSLTANFLKTIQIISHAKKPGCTLMFTERLLIIKDIGDRDVDKLCTMYQVLANQAAAELIAQTLRASNLDLNRPAGQQIESCDGWMFSTFAQDVVVLKRMAKDDCQIYSYIGKGLIQTTPNVVWDAVRNPLTRFTYDETLKKVDILHKVSEQMKVVYYYHEVVQLFRRDSCECCVLQSERIEGDKYLLSMQSIDWNIDNTESNTSIKLLPSGWIIEPAIKDGCLCTMATYLMQMMFDPVPSYASTPSFHELTSKQPLAVAHLREYLRPFSDMIVEREPVRC